MKGFVFSLAKSTLTPTEIFTLLIMDWLFSTFPPAFSIFHFVSCFIVVMASIFHFVSCFIFSYGCYASEKTMCS